jgi:RHS repeat-associated protein
MKKALPYLFLCMAWAALPVRAASVYEAFDYPPGSNLTGQTNPDGLTWLAIGPPGPSIVVGTGSLDFSGLPVSHGHHAEARAVAGFSTLLPFGGDATAGSLYFSLLFKAADLAGLGQDGGSILGFSPADTTQPNLPLPMGGRVFVRSFQGGCNFGLTKSSSALADVVWDSQIVGSNDVVLLVGCYTFADAPGESDQARLWILRDDQLPESQPAATLVSSAGPDLPRLSSFVLLQNPAPAQPGLIQIDDLRVGTAWEQIVPVVGRDFADAPDSYHTLLASKGARQFIRPGWRLGALLDRDPDGMPSLNANGDDVSDGTDDEDGVTFSAIIPSLVATARVDVAVPPGANGYINAWLDFGRDGDWTAPSDHVLVDVPVTAGVHDLKFSVPSWASKGMTYARVRLSNKTGLSFEGPGGVGEVEDYGPAAGLKIGSPNPGAAELTATLIGGHPILRWDAISAVLEEADAVTGPWTAVPDARSPLSVSTDEGMKFFRLRRNEQPRLLQLQPAVVSSEEIAGAAIYAQGWNLGSTDRLRVNGQIPDDQQLVGSNTLRATFPSLAEGTYDVELVDPDGQVLATLDRGLEVTAPLALGLENPPTDAPAADGPCDTCGTVPKGPEYLDLFSGEAHYAVEDLRLRGRGPDLVWKRTYRSRLGPDTAQGRGWDFSYNINLTRLGSDLVLHDGQGRADRYDLQSDGTYARRELSRVISTEPNGGFALRFSDRTRWEFHPLDGSPEAGKIELIQDRNGNRLQFTYDAQGRLAGVTDTLDRVLIVQYNNRGYISTLIDFSGREFHYDYYEAGDGRGSDGDLKSFTTPVVTDTPTGNDFPEGKTTVYTYTTGRNDERLNHNLLTVTDPKGQTWIENTFAPTENPSDLDFDRVLRQRQGDATDLTDVVYLRQTPAPDNGFARLKAVVNDRVGNVAEFFYDSRNRPVAHRIFTGRADPNQPTTETANRPLGKLRGDDPDLFETRFEWNANSKLTRVLYPGGNSMERVYESDLNPDADWTSRGNLRLVRRRPGSAGGDQDEQEETYYYGADLGGCCGANFVTRQVDARGNVTRHTYDANGNRIHTQYRAPGVVEDWEYNPFGQVTAHVHPDNGNGHRRRDEFVYYEEGPQAGCLRAKIVDATGLALTTQFEYDARGNMIRSLDPQGHASTAVFNALDQLVRDTTREVTDGAGVRYQCDRFYDANDNVIRKDRRNLDETGVLQSNGDISIAFDYDVLNEEIREVREVDANHNRVIEYGYDGNRNRILTRQGAATGGDRDPATTGPQPFDTLTVRYDERNLIFQTIRAAGGPEAVTTQYDYDANGRVRQKTESVETASETASFQYDGYGRVVRQVDAMGNVASYAYDPEGNLIWQRWDGELNDQPGGAGNVRLAEQWFAYDAQNRLVRQESAYFDPDTQAPLGKGTVVTLTEYAPISQISRVIDDNGQATIRQYDSANRLSRVTDAKGNSITYTYDASGNVIAKTELAKSDSGQPDQTFVSRYLYDNLNRRIASIDNLGHREHWAYDSLNNLVSVTDAKGNVTRYEYDGLHRLVRTTRYLTADGTGQTGVQSAIVTRQTWDDDSRLTAQTDPNGNTTRHAYDSLGRRIVTRLADGTLRQVGGGATWPAGAPQPDLSGFVSGYDSQNHPVTTTDPNGTVVTAVYDALGRLTGKAIVPGAGVSADTTFERFQYDGMSRMVRAEDDDSVVERRYDSVHHLTGESLNGQTTTSTFDGLGNALECRYPGGRDLRFTWDELNRLQNVIEQNQVVARYRYVGERRIESREFPGTPAGGARLTVWNYDGGQRLIRLTHLRNSQGQPALLTDVSVDWDETGNPVTRVVQNGLPFTQDLSYDSAGRLDGSTKARPGQGPEATGYNLDPAGNRVTVLRGPAAQSYFLDDALPEPADSQVNQYTATPYENQLYDSNGNVSVQAGSASRRDLVYDYANRLVDVNEPAGGWHGHYDYDALGRRIGKWVERGELRRMLRYFYALGHLVEEQTPAGATLATYLYGARRDEVLSMRRNGREYFYLADDLDNVLAVTDSDGNVVESYDYDDFGAPRFYDANGQALGGSGIENDRLFQGRPWDAETGFYQFRHRYLDPLTGRFLTRDPLGIWGDGRNLGNAYTYAGNNPFRFIDPTGLSSTTRNSFVSSKSTWLTIKFIDCSTSKMDKIEDSPDYLSETFASVEDAHDDVHAVTFGGTPANASTLSEMIRWFSGSGSSGSLTSGDKEDIHDVLWDVEDHMRNHTIKIECEASSGGTCSGANAYVVPLSNHLHLCPNYWSSSNSSDERAAILFHEMTHAYAGTADHGYVTGNKTSGTPTYTSGSLTKSKLIDNADTYEEFLQNNWLP